MVSESRKAQLHTLEGLSAALIIVLSMVYSVQAIAVTSTSSTTSSEEIEAQYDRVANDILAQAKSRGTLKEALLNWNSFKARWKGTELSRYYQARSPPGQFGRTLNMTLFQNHLVYNIDIAYQEGNELVTKKFVRNGQPTVNSVTAKTTVVLNDNDRLSGGTKLKNSNFPVKNRDKPRGLYNVVQVRLTVWRR